MVSPCWGCSTVVLFMILSFLEVSLSLVFKLFKRIKYLLFLEYTAFTHSWAILLKSATVFCFGISRRTALPCWRPDSAAIASVWNLVVIYWRVYEPLLCEAFYSDSIEFNTKRKLDCFLKSLGCINVTSNSWGGQLNGCFSQRLLILIRDFLR